MQNMAIKDLIRSGRRQLGMTEQRFADCIGVSRGAVQQWEKGDTAPARKHQEAVAALIGITVGELMTGRAAKYPQPDDTRHLAAEEAATYTDVNLQARTLLAAMNPTGQREAIDYMRYLVTKYPADFSAAAA